MVLLKCNICGKSKQKLRSKESGVCNPCYQNKRKLLEKEKKKMELKETEEKIQKKIGRKYKPFDTLSCDRKRRICAKVERV